MKQPEVKYEPYVGSGEPTKEQVSQNTLYLFETLKHLDIKCTMDNGEYAKKMWNRNEKMIVLTKGKKQFHVLYICLYIFKHSSHPMCSTSSYLAWFELNIGVPHNVVPLKIPVWAMWAVLFHTFPLFPNM